MILPLVHYPDPVLREKGKPVEKFDAKLHALIGDMLETMEASGGVGLAAQQIGRALQLAVVDVAGIDDEDRPSGLLIEGKAVDVEEHMPLFLINPLLEKTKAKVDSGEGCLSFPGLRVEVPRSRRVVLSTHLADGTPVKMEATGFLAIVIQHEYDHLQGKLFIDYLSAEARAAIKPELEALEAAYAPSGEA
ncbi:MAG: peptide deformylase [Verrucomicrobium sp.]|nr:peptide deformylase [Verrucomicrobium sp.]